MLDTQMSFTTYYVCMYHTVQVAAPAVKYKYTYWYTNYKHQHVYVHGSVEPFSLIILNSSLASYYALL